MFISLLPYSLGIVAAIIVPAIIIALQEQQIEGPFGWSSMTFTKRWSIYSLFSKVYRGVTGKDKWATGYHLMSNVIWILIFSMSLLYIPLFSLFSGIQNSDAFLSTAAIAMFSCIQLMWVEDFIWFLLHPYYGPERHKSEYVPWFQNFKGGLPSTYWTSIIAGSIVIIGVSALTGNSKVLIVWAETMFFLFMTVLYVIKPIGMKMKRKSLREYWWKDAKNIILVRCPYPVENEEPFLDAQAYVIDEEAIKVLIELKFAKPLKEVIGE